MFTFTGLQSFAAVEKVSSGIRVAYMHAIMNRLPFISMAYL